MPLEAQKVKDRHLLGEVEDSIVVRVEESDKLVAFAKGSAVVVLFAEEVDKVVSVD